MVDPITSKVVKVADLRTETVRAETRVVKVANAATAAKVDDTVVSKAAETTRALSASAPVDVERVAKIKRAIQEGRFPIFPSTIADRLIAFEQGWRINDPA
jgi:negative regulator of flagellin synthesis FlgM